MHIQTSIFTPVTALAMMFIAIVGVMVPLAKLNTAQRATVASWITMLILSVVVSAVTVFGLLNIFWFLSAEGPVSRAEIFNLYISGFAMYIWVKTGLDVILDRRRQRRKEEINAVIDDLLTRLEAENGGA